MIAAEVFDKAIKPPTKGHYDEKKKRPDRHRAQVSVIPVVDPHSPTPCTRSCCSERLANKNIGCAENQHFPRPDKRHAKDQWLQQILVI